MIGSDGIGDGLQHHRLAGARRSDDQAALAFADGAKHVENASREIFLGRFEANALLRIEGREIVEENFVARDFGVFEIDRFDFN